MTVRCPGCNAEIPDVSRFCLRCGKEIPAPMQVIVQQAPDPDPNGYAMLFFGLAFMMFFSSLAPMFLGLWLGVGTMAAIGLVLVAVGYSILKSNKKEIEEQQEKMAAKIKCRYCGSLNDQIAKKCDACGASL